MCAACYLVGAEALPVTERPKERTLMPRHNRRPVFEQSTKQNK